jgi:hypothetical protein
MHLALPHLALPHLALHRHEFPRRGIGGRVSAFVVDVEAMDNPWPYRVIFGRYASMIEPNLGDRTLYGTWACYNEPMKGWHCVCPRLCLYTTCSTSECVGPNGSDRTGRTDASLPPGAHYDAGRCAGRCPWSWRQCTTSPHDRRYGRHPSAGAAGGTQGSGEPMAPVNPWLPLNPRRPLEPNAWTSQASTTPS